MAHGTAHGSCCAPGRDGAGAPPAAAPVPVDSVPAPPAPTAPTCAAIPLPGGEFLMGAEDPEGFPDDGEGPVRPVRIAPFRIDAHAVTTARFAAFVADTGHVTEAERFGWSYVFAGFLPAALRRGAPRPERTPWWCGVEGAHWRAPEGPGSDLDGRADHPVVHVSWNDARAFCAWDGSRLPTEAEWEYAARGGLVGRRYPWGDELDPDGEPRLNIFRGRFPTKNTAADGYRGTAPVDAFPPNGYGLHNMCGNVWEWCADAWTVPSGSGAGSGEGPGESSGGQRVIRGGSHLCHHSYCNRYRVAARTANTPDSTSGHAGFRCVRDVR